MGKKWGAKRLKRFDSIYDPLKRRVELIDEVPMGIPRDQWVSYVYYRLKEKIMEMCKRNAESKSNKSFYTSVDPNLTLEEGLK